MNSKDKILSNIKSITDFDVIDLPPVRSFPSSSNLAGQFVEVVEKVGGKVIQRDGATTKEIILKQYPKAQHIIWDIDDLNDQSIELKDVEVAVFKSEMAVAENGAVWLSEAEMGARVLPFIAENIVIEVKTRTIVSNLHEAYNRLKEPTGFGVFISGPSKTADIEQHLVIGAHGPEGLLIIIE